MELEKLNEQIGKRVWDLRNKNGLTQQELADRTELTKGFISQLENGQVSPSVETLFDLIECLGTTPSDFFKEEAEDVPVVYTREGYFEKIDEHGSSIQWVIPTAQHNQMEPLLVSIAPGQTLTEDKPHAGEEFGYVISGRVELYLDERRYIVRSGESFYYTADKTHRIANPGNRPARLIWVSTPPNF